MGGGGGVKKNSFKDKHIIHEIIVLHINSQPDIFSQNPIMKGGRLVKLRNILLTLSAILSAFVFLSLRQEVPLSHTHMLIRYEAPQPESTQPYSLKETSSHAKNFNAVISRSESSRITQSIRISSRAMTLSPKDSTNQDSIPQLTAQDIHSSRHTQIHTDIIQRK